VLSLWFAIPVWIRHLAAVLEMDAAELMRKLSQVMFVWVFCYVAWRVVLVVAKRVEKAVEDGDQATLSERKQRGRTISQLLRSVGRVGLVTAGIVLSANVFINIAPVLAGAGILGLAVSFGSG
jgi:small-conductance mechanosensitive channel